MSELSRSSCLAIAGIIVRHPNPAHEVDLRRMLAALRRDNGCKVGTYVNPLMGLYLGWTIRGDAAGDLLPYWNADGTAAQVLLGGEARTPDGGDAGWTSAEFLRSRRGLFSGVVFDVVENRVMLCNDRYGFSRQYYCEDGDGFLFSSEAKALLRVRPSLRTMDEQALGEYFAVGCPLGQRTLFAGIRTLPAASAWLFERGRDAQRAVYFTPKEWEELPSLDVKAYVRELSETFSSVMPRYMDGSRRVGMSMTGGLDSRMLLAGQKLEPGSIACYTFAGPEGETLDVRLARRVAEMLAQPHQVLRLGEDFFNRFPELAARTVYLTDGTFDVCGAHEIYLNRRAAQVAPVRLTGNYGSELFRGATTLSLLALPRQLFNPAFVGVVREGERRFLSMSACHPLTFTLFEGLPRTHFGCQAAAQSEADVRTPYLDPDVAALVYRSPAELRNCPDVQVRYISDRSRLMAIPTDSGLGTNVPRWLQPLKRAHHRAGFKVDYWKVTGLPGRLSTLDPVLKAVDSLRVLPGPHRYLHYPRWLRGAFSEFVRDLLSDRSTAERPFVSRAYLERLVAGSALGGGGAAEAINRILTVELTYRLLVEGHGYLRFAVNETDTVERASAGADRHVFDRPGAVN